MKRLIFLFLILGLASSVFGETCVPHIDTISVDVTVREYHDAGYVSLITKTVEYDDYVSIYNYTRIYLSSYGTSTFCTSACNMNPLSDFWVKFEVVKEQDGDFVAEWTDELFSGNETRKFLSEDKNFTIVVSSFNSDVTCEEEESDDYCSDFTPQRSCSKTNPSHICLRDSEDHYYLDYQPNVCGLSPAATYAEGCVEGTTNVYCDVRKLMRRECVEGIWEYELLEDCKLIDKVCSNVTGTAACTSYKITELDTCVDGTPKGACTSTPPKYCNDVGLLVDNPKICGCPSNAHYEPSTFECIYFKCEDETLVGECSGTLYCSENGTLIVKASLCGCPEGYEVHDDDCVPIEIPLEEVEEPELPSPPTNETAENLTEVVPTNQTTEQVSPTSVEEEEIETTPPAEEEISRESIYLGVIALLVILLGYWYLKEKNPNITKPA